MSSYESLRAQIEAHEAEEARLLAEVAALTTRAEAAEKRADDAEGRASAAAHSLMLLAHAIERTRVATLQSAIEAIEARAVHRGAQVDVAQAANGAWEVVAGKESELLAVADLLRARLRPGPEVATD
jgi:chromosome segregation ATPase